MDKHLISIDYEDWFTTNHYKSILLGEKPKSLIQTPTYKILEVLDSTQSKATFFVLGIIAERHPHLIAEIQKRGHEIASHGYSHTPLHQLSPAKFREEIKKTNIILEDIIQDKVIGFRAPFMSISHQTAWAIDILKEEGFEYDSSVFPIKTPVYGISGTPKSPYHISSENLLVQKEKNGLLEIPISVFNINGIQLPAIGGIYSRFLPFFIFKKIISHSVAHQFINFYFHPWEIINKNKSGIKTTFYKSFLANYNSESYLQKIEWMLSRYSFTSFREKFGF